MSKFPETGTANTILRLLENTIETQMVWKKNSRTLLLRNEPEGHFGADKKSV